ncbi:MAG: hypothetical protein [Sanya fiers-like virus 46]|nr:MAG: hypothetical protein [Sanya fiers-like virus 46]
MAAFANLTINDGLATPVAHTFNAGPKVQLPDGVTRYSWYDFSVNSGVPLGANRIDMDVRMPTPGAGKAGKQAGDSSQQLAVSGRIVLPTLETLSGSTLSGITAQPTHAYDTTLWFKIVRNGRSGQQPVKDALAFMRNFSVLAVLTDTVLLYAPPAN